MGYSTFHRTASAVCYSIARERCAADHRFPVNRTVRFVLAQHGRMPDYLRRPFRLLTLLFDSTALATTGHRFHRLPHVRRWQRIEKWRASRFGACRDLIRFYESLVLFSCKSIEHERA